VGPIAGLDLALVGIWVGPIAGLDLAPDENQTLVFQSSSPSQDR